MLETSPIILFFYSYQRADEFDIVASAQFAFYLTCITIMSMYVIRMTVLL